MGKRKNKRKENFTRLSRIIDEMKGLKIQTLGQEFLSMVAAARGYAPVSGSASASSDAAWGTHLTMIGPTRGYIPVRSGASITSGPKEQKQQQLQRERLERFESFP